MGQQKLQGFYSLFSNVVSHDPRSPPNSAKLLTESQAACRKVIATNDDDEAAGLQVVQEGDEVGDMLGED
jgi:hypothetical protein